MANQSTQASILADVKHFSLIVPERIALVDCNREITYNQLQREITTVQALLRDRYNVKHADRVGVFTENTIDCVVIMLAIISLSAIAVIINTKLAQIEIDYIIYDSKPMLIAIGNNEHMQHIQSKVPFFKIAEINHALMMNNNIVCFSDAYQALDPAFIIYTSGTTGHPKGAMITHRNLAHSAYSYTKSLGLIEEDSTIIAAPLFYVTSLIAQLMTFLSIGAKSILMHRFDEYKMARSIEYYHITHLHAVATIYIRFLTAITQKKFNLTSIRQVLCGGGPITTLLIEKLKAVLPNIEFRRIYGLTESSGTGCVMPVDSLLRPDKPISSGLPMPEVELKVVDDEGLVELPPDVPGELWIKGPIVIESYWNNPEANCRSFTDGWLKTGDIARIDHDGYVFILDRKKDMIIRGGEKVFSSEVEVALALHPGVSEVAVVGIPDEYYGEAVKAYIVASAGASLSAEDIIRFARRRLAKFKVPTSIEFVIQLPRSPVGKVLKSSLRGDK